MASKGIRGVAVIVALLMTTSAIGYGSMAGPEPGYAQTKTNSIAIQDVTVTPLDGNQYRVEVHVITGRDALADATVTGTRTGALNLSLNFEEVRPGVYATTTTLFYHGEYHITVHAAHPDHGQTRAETVVAHRLDEFNFAPVEGWYLWDRSVTVQVGDATYRAYRAWDTATADRDGRATWLVLTADGQLAEPAVTEAAAFTAMVQYQYFQPGPTREQTRAQLDRMIDLWADDLLSIDFDDLTGVAFTLRKLRDLAASVLTKVAVRAGRGAVHGGVVGAKLGAVEGLVDGGLTTLLIGLPVAGFEMHMVRSRVTSRLEAGAENATAARRILTQHEGEALDHETARSFYEHWRAGTLSGFGAMYARTALEEGSLEAQIDAVVEEIAKTGGAEATGPIVGSQVEAAIVATDTAELDTEIDEAWIDSRRKLAVIEGRFAEYEREATLAPELREDLARHDGVTLVGEITLTPTVSVGSESLEPGAATTLSVAVTDESGTPVAGAVSYRILETDHAGTLTGSTGEYDITITAPDAPGRYTIEVTVTAYGETVVRTADVVVRPGVLTATPETWELGHITPDTVAETTIAVENTGDVTTEITIRSGGGVTITDHPNRLRPGETGRVTARLDAAAYDGAPVVVDFAGGQLIVPIDVTVVSDEDLLRSRTDSLSDEFYDCATIADVVGRYALCGERTWQDTARIDPDDLEGLASASLTIEYRPGGPEEQDRDLFVYLNDEFLTALPSPSDNDEYVTETIDLPISDVEAENDVRLETNDASSYDIGRNTELAYSYFRAPHLVLRFGEFDRVVEVGEVFRVPVTIENVGGRPAEDVILGLGSETTYDAIEVVKWPRDYGSDTKRTLDPKQSDVRYFEFRLLEETTATIEAAAGGPGTFADRSTTVRPPNDPPVLTAVEVTPTRATAANAFTYEVAVTDPDDDPVRLTLEVYHPASESWQTVGTRRVHGAGSVSWTYDGFTEADERTVSDFRLVYADGRHTGPWGPFTGPRIRDDDTDGPAFEAWDYPATIAPGESIPVTVALSDPSGVADATLTARYPNGTTYTTALDQSRHGWTAVLPPAAAGDRGELIGFTVTATDGDTPATTAESHQRAVEIDSGTLASDIEPDVAVLSPTRNSPTVVPPTGDAVWVEVGLVLHGTATEAAVREELTRDTLTVTMGTREVEILERRVGAFRDPDGGMAVIELHVNIPETSTGAYNLSVAVERADPCWPDSDVPCTSDRLTATDTNARAIHVGTDPATPTPRPTDTSTDVRSPTPPSSPPPTDRSTTIASPGGEEIGITGVELPGFTPITVLLALITLLGMACLRRFQD